MTTAWILGSTGLLGAALCRVLRSADTQLYTPDRPLIWKDSVGLREQMAAAVLAFAQKLRPTDRWEIYWAAGVGTMSSPVESLSPETEALALLLHLLESDPNLAARPGSVCFASSAGAIYAGSTDEVITEQSESAPTTAYAAEKLKQEALIRSFVAANPNASTLIARISTLYGAGQALGKKQGLLGHIARCIVRNHPIQIYVPYDTIRDYIDADDAAASMIGAARGAPAKDRILTKIIASEHPATIAEIISIFNRLARRAPRIVRSANNLTPLYSRRVQFKSIISAGNPAIPNKRLPVGISQLIMAERLAFTRNRKPDV